MANPAARRAELVLACDDLESAMAFYCRQLGFELTQLMPADQPRQAWLSGYGLCLRLDCSQTTPDRTRLRLFDPSLNDQRSICAPNGTHIELVPGIDQLDVPTLVPQYIHCRLAQSSWTEGRAGMRYRDLIPGRQGGRFVASHIQIDEPGPVPDYVHYHKVRFQFIYCWRGRAKLVYEDQGAPFTLQAGDCVLQPPEIRHRVLESAGPLEVIEFGCPAEHPTYTDPSMTLPTETINHDRLFSGQRFVWFRAAEGRWYREGTMRYKRTGIGRATDGLVSVRVLELASGTMDAAHQGELLFFAILGGDGSVETGTEASPLRVGDALTVPAGQPCVIRATDQTLRMLQVTCPAP